MIGLILLTSAPWPASPPSAETWAVLLGSAFFCTALAYILYFRILIVSGTTNVLLVTLLIPVSALLLNSIFLGEEVFLTHLAGMGLIAAALLAVDGRIPAALARACGRSDKGS